MPPIRFIHAADLHLDAAFSGLSRDIPADFAERLRTATFTAFRRLLDLCERESPDFLLLAGDVYNQEDASVSAQLALRDGFRRLESLSIPVFLVHGNHDPLASRLRSVRWPGNVTVFGELPDAVPVFRKGEGTPLAIIHGASHASGRETRNLAALFRRTEACGLHVGLLHATPGDADGVARYAPFSQGDLKASGMDYWALGHIHDRREVCREPLAAYPGCTQGLHINEPGEKGCLLVTAEARPDGGYAVRTSFRPLGPAVWKTLDMDLGGAASLDELENRLRTGLDRAAAEVWSGCEMLLVRLRLQGTHGTGRLLRKGTNLRGTGGSGSVWGGCRYSGVFRLVRRGGQRGLGSGARKPRGPPVHACGRRGAACRFPAYAGSPSGAGRGLGNAFPSAPSGCVAFRDHTGLGFGMEPVRAGPASAA